MSRPIKWAFLIVSLFIAPVGLVIIGYTYPTLPSNLKLFPSDARDAKLWCHGLFHAHFVLTVFAAVFVYQLTRRWPTRTIIWILLALWLALVACIALVTVMKKTGIYL